MIPVEILRELQDLKAAGYTLIPCDAPEGGMHGVYAFREDIDKEVSQEVSWPMFSRRMTPEVSIVSAKEFLDFIRTADALGDDPKRREIGCVKYYPDEGRSVVKRIGLTALRNAKYHIDEIMALRKPLLNQSDVRAKAFLAELAEL